MSEASKIPPIQFFNAFCHDIGWSEVTGWRARKKGWIETVNICGRQYITAEEVQRFTRRAAAGEFATRHKTPTRDKATAIKK